MLLLATSDPYLKVESLIEDECTFRMIVLLYEGSFGLVF
jgi:hypothetical protein